MADIRIAGDGIGGDAGRAERVQLFVRRQRDHFLFFRADDRFFGQEVFADDGGFAARQRVGGEEPAGARRLEVEREAGDAAPFGFVAGFVERFGFNRVAEAVEVLFVVDPEIAVLPDRDPVEFFFEVFGFEFLDFVEHFPVFGELRDDRFFEFFAVFDVGQDRFDVDRPAGGIFRAFRVAVDGDPPRAVELAGAVPGCAPRTWRGRRADFVFRTRFGAFFAHAPAPRGDEFVFRVEALDPVVAAVDDVDVAGAFVDGDAGGPDELAVAEPGPGADRFAFELVTALAAARRPGSSRRAGAPRSRRGRTRARGRSRERHTTCPATSWSRQPSFSIPLPSCQSVGSQVY